MKNTYSSQYTNEHLHSTNKHFNSSGEINVGKESFSSNNIPPPILMPEYLDIEYASLNFDNKYILGSTSYILPGSGMVEALLGRHLIEAISSNSSSNKANPVKAFENTKMQMKTHSTQTKLVFHSPNVNKNKHI